jgi:hypothetical protein
MRSAPFLVSLIALAGAGACATPEAVVEQPASAPQPMITGGYSPASLDDEWVKAAQAMAVNEIYRVDKTSATVQSVSAQQQVVAGLNYRFDITLSDNSRFGVTVYRDLQGGMQVTNFEKLG